ncbi:hypothetical protein DFJ74DRAFT_645610 [Hyaloraphidium curvatum]|nr:hypothetical protein DFJ74DRAFT_645610 [Hyaloraphidium curvatum]
MRGPVRAALVLGASALLAAGPSAAYIPGYERSWGSPSDDYASAIELLPADSDALGAHAVIVGHSAGAAAYAGGACAGFAAAPGTPRACGGSDLFVHRVTAANGTTVWRAALGSPVDDAAVSVATDAYGMSVFVLAFAQRPAGAQPYVLKLDAANGRRNGTRFIGNGSDYSILPGAAKVNPVNGDLFISGHWNGLATPDGGSCWRGKGGLDVFVCRMSPDDLSYKWCRGVGTAADERVRPTSSSIAFDMHGNVFVAGNTFGSFDDPNGAPKTSADAFVAKLDGNGNIAWVRQLGDPGADEEAISVAYEPWRERLYVIGATKGSFGDEGNRNHGGQDIFLAQLDPQDGSVAWAKIYGGTGDEYPTDLQTYKEHVFFAATQVGPNWATYWTDPDGLNKTNPDGTIRLYYNSAPLGGSDWLLCEVVHTLDDGLFDWTNVPKGMPRWCSRFGSTADDTSSGLRVDSTFNMYAVGTMDGQMARTKEELLLPAYGGKDAGLQQYYEYEKPLWDDSRTMDTSPQFPSDAQCDAPLSVKSTRTRSATDAIGSMIVPATRTAGSSATAAATTAAATTVAATSAAPAATTTASAAPEATTRATSTRSSTTFSVPSSGGRTAAAIFALHAVAAIAGLLLV